MLAAAALMVVWSATDAYAGWGHRSWGSHGSSGGSWGSRGGSSGGSWGSHGSHGSHGSRGGLFHRIKTRMHARHHASHGSRGGSWGSSGGSWGSRGYSSYGSSGGYRYYSASSGGSSGGYVRYGSSGYSSVGYRSGVVYSGTPVYGSPVYTTPAVPGPAYTAPVLDGTLPSNGVPATGQPVPAGEPPTPGPRTGTGVDESDDGDTAILNLRLPLDAVVYVNGKRTTTEGSFRSYVSRNLTPGKRYTYEVRAEIEEDGQRLARTKVVQLSAGTNKTLDIDFNQDRQLLTSVTLMVPDDAQVKMGGVETKATGGLRYFSTESLKEGEKWENYTVSVTVNRDGQDVTREKVINVAAGDSVNLQFDFDLDEKVASR